MKMQTYPLWEGDIPGSTEGGQVPAITYYAAEHKTGRGTFVIFAGGGYRILSEFSGDRYAIFLNQNGYDAFVVTYRLEPAHFPAQLLDARRAVRFVRANAERFGIDPQKIAVMGSSAGGHLAALVSTHRGPLAGEGADALDEVDYRPNATILCYSVVNTTEDGIRHFGSVKNLLGEENLAMAPEVSPDRIAGADTPPAFIWHTAADASVNVINSYRYATKLRELNVPVEMHIFPYGAHGLALANEGKLNNPYVSRWSDMLIQWLDLNHFKGE